MYKEKKNETQRTEFLADVPYEVQIALKVLLSHVEPGYENCKTRVEAWLRHIELEGPLE